MPKVNHKVTLESQEWRRALWKRKCRKKWELILKIAFLGNGKRRSQSSYWHSSRRILSMFIENSGLRYSKKKRNSYYCKCSSKDLLDKHTVEESLQKLVSAVLLLWVIPEKEYFLQYLRVLLSESHTFG